MQYMALGSQRQTALLRGVLDLCLLAVMDEGPAYGYEMTKRLRDRGLAIVGEGSIYPLLGRLERDGLVETYRAASNGGPPRKYYRPSSAGQLGTRDGRVGMASCPRCRRCGARSRQDRGGFMSDFVEQCRRNGSGSVSPIRSPRRWRPT
jgi:PadR family transcriptional regulator PadR